VLLSLGVITENPVLVTSDNPGQEGCIVGADLTKLLANFDKLLLLNSSQKSHQARYTIPYKRTYKITTPTQLRDILYTDSQDMLVLSSAVASRYYNCCTDGSTSPGNYGYYFVGH
jgi:hypothetical protein